MCVSMSSIDYARESNPSQSGIGATNATKSLLLDHSATGDFAFPCLMTSLQRWGLYSLLVCGCSLLRECSGNEHEGVVFRRDGG